MRKTETMTINHKDGHLWWNASTNLDMEEVLSPMSYDVEPINASLECLFHYGLCLASAEIVVAQNKNGLYTIMTPWADTMGYGAIYCSILPGFCFKDVYCYSPEFEANEIIIAKDKDDCWGAIEISRNNCLWGSANSFMMPTLICPFNYENKEQVLKILKINESKCNSADSRSIFVNLIGLDDTRLNALSDKFPSWGNNDSCELLLPPQRHLSLDEKESRYKELLRYTQAPKIENLIKHLEKMGFFIAPGSLKHHRFKGGLVSHSLEVFYKAMKLRNQKIKEGVSPESIPVKSIIIAALLHDVCKADLLRYDKNLQEVVEVRKGKGHSERSVRQIGYSGFTLSPLEKDAILWHMGGKGIEKDENIRAQHFASHPLSDIINKADGRSISDAKKRHHPKITN